VSLSGCGSDSVTNPPAVPFKPTLGVFLPQPPLPEPRAYVSVIEVGGFVYAVGGLPPSTPSAIPPGFANATTSVFVSRLLADGSLEPWGVTSSLNAARSRTALAAWAPATGTRYLLAIGGGSADGFPLSSIERAIILPDGSLSAWRQVAPLPSSRNESLVAQTADLVVLPGGFRPGGETRVLMAALGPEGLGAWREAAPLPEPTVGGSALAIGDRVHVTIGNTNGASWSAAAYSATIDGAGTLASWRRAPSLGVARYFGALAGDGHGGLLMLGGIMPTGNANSLEHTASDAGSLLGWTPLGVLPVPTGAVAAIGARDAVYVFGGLVGEGSARRPTADVWRAPLL
jgi:hypothetical protein